MTRRALAAMTALLVSGGVRPATGQTLEPTRTDAPLFAGPLQLFPALTIRDIGIDSNVYNDSQVLREDFTYTVSPMLRAVLPIGESRLITRVGLDFRYFHTLKDQQSTSGVLNAQFDIGSGRVRPFGAAGVVRSHERGGYDLNTRAFSVATQAKVGASIALTPITSFTGWVVRETTSYERGAEFEGVTLSDPLNRAARGAATGLRFDLTPFTSVTSVIEIEKIRFAHAPLRDANSFRFAPVVQFTTGAVIEGQASAGFRDFSPLDTRLAPYRGFVASLKLGFTLFDVTRFEAQGGNDVQFSYDDAQPLYLEAGARLTVAQRVAGPFEAILIGGRHRLRYQSLDRPSFDGRLEYVTAAGGGLGVQVNSHLRLTFTVDREERESGELERRNYTRRRVLGSISYTP